MTNKQIQEKITSKIIKKMKEENSLVWNKGYIELNKCNLLNGFDVKNQRIEKAYRGINILMLALFSKSEDTFYLTYNQIKKLGGYVRKGESGSPIVFYAPVEKKLDKEKGIETFKKNFPDADINDYIIPEKEHYWCMRSYTIFGESQVEGIDYPEIDINQDKEKIDINDFIKSLKNNGLKLNHLEKDRAYFSHSQDYISLPEHKQFENNDRYYSTLFHELVHWTGHKDRLDRIKHDAFGDEKYSFEELVAEIGSCFLCSMFGIKSVKNNNVAYIQSWINKLEEHTDWIIKAANKAGKAIEYLMELIEAKDKKTGIKAA